MAATKVVKGVDLNSVSDPDHLNALLDQVEDLDDRKLIRDRLRVLHDEEKVRREELITRLESFREDNIKKKLQSSAAERQKEMVTLEEASKHSKIGQRMHDFTPMVDAGPANAPAKIGSTAPSLDFMQDSLKERVTTADSRKNKVLNQYDELAKQAKPAQPQHRPSKGPSLAVPESKTKATAATNPKQSEAPKITKKSDAANVKAK